MQSMAVHGVSKIYRTTVLITQICEYMQLYLQLYISFFYTVLSSKKLNMIQISFTSSWQLIFIHIQVFQFESSHNAYIFVWTKYKRISVITVMWMILGQGLICSIMIPHQNFTILFNWYCCHIYFLIHMYCVRLHMFAVMQSTDVLRCNLAYLILILHQTLNNLTCILSQTISMLYSCHLSFHILYILHWCLRCNLL